MMATLTKEQWAQIETELSRYVGSVKLRCDGYDVTAAVQTIAPMRQGIVVYVNGVWKGEWMNGEAEEAKKFHRPMKRYFHSEKVRKEYAANAKKRKASPEFKEFFSRQAEAHTVTWAPYWTNARDFCRNLRKTCSEIELVRIGYGSEG